MNDGIFLFPASRNITAVLCPRFDFVGVVRKCEFSSRGLVFFGCSSFIIKQSWPRNGWKSSEWLRWRRGLSSLGECSALAVGLITHGLLIVHHSVLLQAIAVIAVLGFFVLLLILLILFLFFVRNGRKRRQAELDDSGDRGGAADGATEKAPMMAGAAAAGAFNAHGDDQKAAAAAAGMPYASDSQRSHPTQSSGSAYMLARQRTSSAHRTSGTNQDGASTHSEGPLISSVEAAAVADAFRTAMRKPDFAQT